MEPFFFGKYRKFTNEGKGSFYLKVVHGLFEGAYYNTQMGEVRGVYSRTRTKQGHRLIGNTVPKLCRTLELPWLQLEKPHLHSDFTSNLIDRCRITNLKLS